MIPFLCFTKDKTLFVSICLYKHGQSTERYIGWSMFQQRLCFSKDIKDLIVNFNQSKGGKNLEM